MFFRFQVYTIHLSENILTHGNCGCRRQSLWVTRSTLQKRARPPKALVTGWHAPVSTPSRSRRVCHLSAGSGARYQAALCESVIGFLSSLSSTPTVVTFVNVTQDTRALSIFVAPGQLMLLVEHYWLPPCTNSVLALGHLSLFKALDVFSNIPSWPVSLITVSLRSVRLCQNGIPF